MRFGAILENYKCFKVLFILNVHIVRSEDGFFTVTLAPEAKNVTFLTIGIMQLWRPQKMANFLTHSSFAKMNNRSAV